MRATQESNAGLSIHLHIFSLVGVYLACNRFFIKHGRARGKSIGNKACNSRIKCRPIYPSTHVFFSGSPSAMQQILYRGRLQGKVYGTKRATQESTVSLSIHLHIFSLVGVHLACNRFCMKHGRGQGKRYREQSVQLKNQMPAYLSIYTSFL